jgi:hypothetical protein
MAPRTRFAAITVALVLAVAPAMLTGSSTAMGAVPSASRLIPLPFELDAKPRLTEDSTAVHLTVVQRGCGPIYDHARLARSPRRLTITLLGRPWSTPTSRAVACPDYVAIRPVAVGLGRSLGRRSLYDGAYSPPRLVEPG